MVFHIGNLCLNPRLIIRSGNDLIAQQEAVLAQEFCQMTSNPDEERLDHLRKRKQNMSRSDIKLKEQAKRSYQNCLRQAEYEVQFFFLSHIVRNISFAISSQKDFEDLVAMKFIYRAGIYSFNIVLICACHFDVRITSLKVLITLDHL